MKTVSIPSLATKETIFPTSDRNKYGTVHMNEVSVEYLSIFAPSPTYDWASVEKKSIKASSPVNVFHRTDRRQAEATHLVIVPLAE
jgi:hypothetical protein